MSEQFRKLINLVEARIPDIEYHDDAKSSTAKLKSYNSQVYTKLAQKVQRIQQLESEIKALKEEVKTSAREDVADLFDAEDAVKTRVVETIQFILTLSKDPAPTNTPKYKDILEALTNHLTPELIEVLEGLKKEMVTVTQKSPSLTVKPLKEALGDVFAKIKTFVFRWAESYDQKLDALKAELAM